MPSLLQRYNHSTSLGNMTEKHVDGERSLVLNREAQDARHKYLQGGQAALHDIGQYGLIHRPAWEQRQSSMNDDAEKLWHRSGC
eukprot:scaffold104114_cov41-Prasinocladus_malaysianus.AAC.2